MLVSFPMYALAETRVQQAAWWAAVSRRFTENGLDAPGEITHVKGDLYSHWRHRDLLLSQACGFPLVSRLRTSVKVVGALQYDTPYCRGIDYCSLLIVRGDDPRSRLEDYAGTRLAYNSIDSQSGFNALRQSLLERNLTLPFFGRNICSGSHRKSIRQVARGEADLCAVDCVTYALLAKHQPEVTDGTRVLGPTRHTPGLPLITAASNAEVIVDALVSAIGATCSDPDLEGVNRDLLIGGIQRITLDQYGRAISIPDTLPVIL